MVFKPKNANVWKLRVTHSTDASIDPILSTGTTDRAIADDMERMVSGFRAQRKWAWVDLIAEKKVKLPKVYDAFVSGQVDAFFAAVLADEQDLDLDPLVEEWKKRALPRYVTQLRELMPAGTRFPLSDFRPKVLKTRLLALSVAASTRHKYKAALSDFAKWLIENEYLELNPARSITLPKAKRPDKALKALSPDQAKKLILAQDGEQRVIEAVMFGSGAEWQAIDRLYKRDVDLKHRLIYAHGTKTERFGDFRDRWIEVTEEWCWDILVAWAKGMMPDAKVFQRKERYALERHQDVAAELLLPKTTLHQYRHTFAKMWIDRGAAGGMREDGRDLQWLKNQLGHAPESQLALDTYGVDIKAARLTEKQKARMRAEEKKA